MSATAAARPWFLTLSLRQFFYDAPEAYDYSIPELAHALSHESRYGGHIQELYSVAQHSVLVAREVWRTTQDPELARGGLIHDASEGMSLKDLVRPFKRLPQMAGYRAYEDRVQRAIALHFGLLAAHDHAAIKAADMAILATEKRDLRPPSPFDPVDLGKALSHLKIKAWTPKRARKEFLATWVAFGGPPP